MSITRAVLEHETFRNHRRYMRRLYDPERRCYMHLNGHMVTSDLTLAWCGTPAQAEALMRQWDERGEAWGFHLYKMETDK